MIGNYLLATLIVAASLYAQTAASKSEKIDPVAVVGCLQEPKPGTWMLVNASEPVASTANAPSAKELAALPKSGKNEFQLIGVGIFDLGTHRDRSVLIKGLPIKTPAVTRLNVTSVTVVAPNCAR